MKFESEIHPDYVEAQIEISFGGERLAKYFFIDIFSGSSEYPIGLS